VLVVVFEGLVVGEAGGGVGLCLVVVLVVIVPKTQYEWPTTSVGQLTPGLRDSNSETEMLHELATESQVSPLLACTA
jgi:hypothetical protein